MTIAEAAREALRRHHRPMTVDEIYEVIISEGLTTFRSAHPKGVLRTQIRRHCRDVAHASPAKTKYFVVAGANRYTLAL